MRTAVSMLAAVDVPDGRVARDIVRRGYDAISYAYRTDAGETDRDPTVLLGPLLERLPVGARVLDLGCGCGVPFTRLLAERFHVTGVDLSPVQLDRACRLVSGAAFVCADMTAVAFPAGAFDGVAALYSLIHVPLEEQPALLARIRGWLAPGGVLAAVVGKGAWTGTEDDWLGAPMYWSHADEDTYAGWLEALGFRVLERRFLPEGDGGHVLMVAAAPAPPSGGGGEEPHAR
jgi:SAM-dependent methyltransferase